MPRVQIIDRRTHTVLLEGDSSLPSEEIRTLMARHDVTAVDAAHVSGSVVLDAAAPAAPVQPQQRRKERKAS